MELIFILIAIIYSVWSEVNKKKEEEVDIDFSELSSLDEFFKKDKAGGAVKKSAQGNSIKAVPPFPEKKVSAASAGPTRQENYTRVDENNRKKKVNYDKLPGLTGQENYTRVDENNRKKKVNYDKLPGLTRQVNYTRESDDDVVFEPMIQQESESSAGSYWPSAPSLQPFSFDKNDMVKAFIINEVMQRYDLNRIYARIPGTSRDE